MLDVKAETIALISKLSYFQSEGVGTGVVQWNCFYK